MEEALTVFIAVERVDESNPQYVVDKAVESIVNVAGQVRRKTSCFIHTLT